MPLTCPACNKPGQTEAACARCGCDLSRLHTVLEAAASRLSAARAALEVCDWPGARAQAERSWRLCHTVASARVAFLAAAGAGDVAGAATWHRRAHAALAA
jgi:hypothetical protein